MSTQAFLTTDERSALEVIATGDAPWNQRAKALLALDDGETDERSAEIAGLRDTQVRYWASRFERAGLDAFPAGLAETIATAAPKEEAPAPEADPVVEVETALAEPAPTAVIPEPPKAIVAEEAVVSAVVAVEAEAAPADEKPAKKKSKKKKKVKGKKEDSKKGKKDKGKKAKDKKKSKKKDKKGKKAKAKKSGKDKKKAKAKKKAKKK